MAGGDKLKLLGKWASPFVTRVELALRLKGLSYEYVKQDLSYMSNLLLTSNPVNKKVPVLIHNGNPICESRIILVYLDEAFPVTGAALLPVEPYHRAVTRFWTAYIDDKFIVSWVPAFRGKMEKEKAEGMKQILMAVETLEGTLKDRSEENPFFSGNTVRLFNITLAALIPRVRATEVLTGAKIFDATKTALLAPWVEQFGELDAAKKVLPDVDRMAEYVKMRWAEWAAADAAVSMN